MILDDVANYFQTRNHPFLGRYLSNSGRRSVLGKLDVISGRYGRFEALNLFV
jgi:hypothetical protein